MQIGILQKLKGNIISNITPVLSKKLQKTKSIGLHINLIFFHWRIHFIFLVTMLVAKKHHVNWNNSFYILIVYFVKGKYIYFFFGSMFLSMHEIKKDT